MTDQEEFDGDQCVVLPSNYLNSAEAVAEIYEEQLSAGRKGFDSVQFRRAGFFKGSLMTLVLWALSGVLTVCY
jgi:hypothetical protein